MPARLGVLVIACSITGLIGIGFQSVGGMLTGDNEPPEEPTVTTAEAKEGEKNEKEVEFQNQTVSYKEVEVLNK